MAGGLFMTTPHKDQVLMHLIRHLLASGGRMAEAPIEGLAFPNRPSREPLGAEAV
jgi:hypothetical protein